MALGFHHGLAALFTVAYGIGSPDIAPLLPRSMEFAFGKLHKDFNEIGKSVYQSTSAAVEAAAKLTSSQK